MEWINKKMMTWGGPVNLLILASSSLGAFFGKIYENRKVWLIVMLGMFAAFMGLLRMRIDKLVSDDKSKMETDLRATIDRLTDLNEELIHRNKELMSEVRSLKDEVKSLRDEVNTLQTTIDNQSSKIDSMQTTIDNQSSKIDSMESNVGNVQESTNDTRDVLTTKMETLKSNVDDVRESTNETRDDVKSLKTGMRQMQDAIMEMQPSDYQYQEIVDAEIETFMGH